MTWLKAVIKAWNTLMTTRGMVSPVWIRYEFDRIDRESRRWLLEADPPELFEHKQTKEHKNATVSRGTQAIPARMEGAP